ncbi:MAG: DUF4389 domain-containing protein [Gammaproteobacteria bacterium]|nr:DUF4389 domain-containing protein [Gammaproteobacteria bacterium]
METTVQDRPRESGEWPRLLFMLLFAFVMFNVLSVVFVALLVAQFVFRVASGEVNARLHRFGAQLCRYGAQILSYITYTSDTRPFPFADWPAGEAETD